MDFIVIANAPPRAPRGSVVRVTPLVFDGSAREDAWPVLRVEADNTRLPVGHFVHLHPAALVAAPSTPEEEEIWRES